MNKLSLVYCIIMIIFSSQLLQAKLKLPTNLNSDEQIKVTKVLGFGFTPGLNTHLIPLGGYDGAEVSLGYQSVSTSTLFELDRDETSKQSTTVPQLYLSKGLYEDIDVGLSFTPGLQSEDVQLFHIHGRWSYLPYENWPYLLGINLYAAGSQWQNLLQTRTLGLDLYLVRYFEKFSINAGYGRARCIARFIGGVDGLTASGESEQVDVFENRVFAGAGYQLGKFLFALQVFRFSETTYNFNFGYRF